jgi:hypothetical protein
MSWNARSHRRNSLTRMQRSAREYGARSLGNGIRLPLSRFRSLDRNYVCGTVSPFGRTFRQIVISSMICVHGISRRCILCSGIAETGWTGMMTTWSVGLVAEEKRREPGWWEIDARNRPLFQWFEKTMNEYWDELKSPDAKMMNERRVQDHLEVARWYCQRQKHMSRNGKRHWSISFCDPRKVCRTTIAIWEWLFSVFSLSIDSNNSVKVEMQWTLQLTSLNVQSGTIEMTVCINFPCSYKDKRDSCPQEISKLPRGTGTHRTAHEPLINCNIFLVFYGYTVSFSPIRMRRTGQFAVGNSPTVWNSDKQQQKIIFSQSTWPGRTKK